MGDSGASVLTGFASCFGDGVIKACVVQNHGAVRILLHLRHAFFIADHFAVLFLHFEDGVLFSEKDAVSKVKKDFMQMFTCSENVSEVYRLNSTRRIRIIDALLRLLAPLL